MRSLVGCLAAVLLLAGCTAEPAPEPTSTPSTPTEALSSEEEARTLAERLYAEYLRTSNAILSEGGVHPERILPFVTEQLAKSELESYETYQAAGNRTSGASSFDNFRIQSVTESAGTTTITAYLCFDVSNSRLINSTGEDTSKQR